MKKEWFTTREIAEATQTVKRTIERRANREQWAFEFRSARGGQQKIFALNSLPEEIQAALRPDLRAGKFVRLLARLLRPIIREAVRSLNKERAQ